jgi:uncharacterized iron-regulated membrane protein
MKISGRTYRALFDAHAWGGAIASVLLVTMFVLGVVSLFHDELLVWQEPHVRGPQPDESQTLAAAQQALTSGWGATAPTRIDIDLPDEGVSQVRLGWTRPDGVSTAVWVDPRTGARTPERSDLGHFLFLMHFLYPLPGGMFTAGVIATLLLLIVVTGLGLQLGRFWREALRFRPRESLRVMWGDLHKVLGSVGLPFQAMVAWTAAIICLNATVIRPAVVHTAFDGSLAAGLASIGAPEGPKRTKRAGPAPDLAAALATARRTLPASEHGRLQVKSLGDEAVYVDVRGVERDGLFAFTTVRTGPDGALLHARSAGGPGVTSKLIEGAYVLHSGEFAGLGLRLAYAALGLFSVLCVVTGNLVWLERRSGSLRRFDIALARLTAGGCGAAATSLAMVLLANVLLPDGLTDRPSIEHRVFYAAWLITLCAGLTHPRPAAFAALVFAGAGTILLSLPAIEGLSSGRVPFGSGVHSALFGVDVALTLTGVAFVATALAVRRFALRASPELQQVTDGQLSSNA